MNIDAIVAKAELISKFKDGEKKYQEDCSEMFRLFRTEKL